MTDLITLRLIAGDGGMGRISFRREKYVQKGGPDGGDGGDGGSIILKASKSLSTLKKYAGVVQLEAENGDPGGKKKSFGKKGSNLIIDVPVGTVVWSIAENQAAFRRVKEIGINHTLKRSDVKKQKYFIEKEGEAIAGPDEESWLSPITGDEIDPSIASIIFDKDHPVEEQLVLEKERFLLAELREDGQEIVVCQGGFGGRGNTAFKGSTNTTPLEAEYGSRGEKRALVLELKLLADVGFVGYPNAGKSTLLSVLTDAKPKIANYPFTTLEPHLGIFRLYQNENVHELILADIPGLIEGASQGKGLGHQFLRHIENCSKLLYVLYLDDQVLFDTNLSSRAKSEYLINQFKSLEHELKQRQPELINKPYNIVINKCDLYDQDLRSEITKNFNAHELQFSFISAVTQEGIQELKLKLIA